MRPRLLEFATFAAYLPASAIPTLAGRAGAAESWDPGLLVVPFCAAFAIAFPVWGRVADRCDRRVTITAGLLLLSAAGLVVAAASSPAVAVLGRALTGLGAAAIPPAAQAELTRRSGDARAGRAIGGMMIAVAIATLGGPILAKTIEAAGAGWTGTTLALGTAVPLIAGVAAWLLAAPAPAPGERRRTPTPLHLNRGLTAGWVVSALVLAGYWTVLTRLGVALGEDGLDASEGLALAAPLTGALGIPLVVLAARATDRLGPRLPMLATLATGAVSFAGAAVAATPAAFVAAAGVGLAAYWAYLPTVSVQVQRSADPAARGRAVGWLYASMWSGAAVAGAAGALAGDWRPVLLGAGAAWLVAFVVAARGFLSHPTGAQSSASWQPRTIRLTPRPSTR
jgi:MFS family permease